MHYHYFIIPLAMYYIIKQGILVSFSESIKSYCCAVAIVCSYSYRVLCNKLQIGVRCNFHCYSAFRLLVRGSVKYKLSRDQSNLLCTSYLLT